MKKSIRHCKTFGINFKKLQIIASSIKNSFYKKPYYRFKKKMSQMAEKTATNGYLYAPVSQKLFSKIFLKSFHLTLCMIKKILSLRKNLFTMTAFLTSAFRLKLRMKTTCGNKQKNR